MTIEALTPTYDVIRHTIVQSCYQKVYTYLKSVISLCNLIGIVMMLVKI